MRSIKALLISDKENSYLWDYYTPGCLKGAEMILSCGDLKSSYLEFLTTMNKGPLYYVRGNHDSFPADGGPGGCDCVEDKIINFNGVRILGLGGVPKYNGGANQYTEKQMKLRIFKLGRALRKNGGFDILLCHAPPRGYGDGDDFAHRGFECFLPLIDEYKPKYVIHGHVHMNYGKDIPRTIQYGETTIINAYDKYFIDI